MSYQVEKCPTFVGHDLLIVLLVQIDSLLRGRTTEMLIHGVVIGPSGTPYADGSVGTVDAGRVELQIL